MRVTPTGASEYTHDGREVLRYGRDIGGLGPVAVWYHCGLRKYDEPAWAMQKSIEHKVSVSVDHFIVVEQPEGAWLMDRDAFTDCVEAIDGTEQYVARASDPHVRPVRDPASTLGGGLYVESGNEVNEGYHKRRNEA